MVTITLIAVPSFLLALLLEVRDGRVSALIAGMDGGIAIGAGTIALHAAGAL